LGCREEDRDLVDDELCGLQSLPHGIDRLFDGAGPASALISFARNLQIELMDNLVPSLEQLAQPCLPGGTASRALRVGNALAKGLVRDPECAADVVELFGGLEAVADELS